MRISVNTNTKKVKEIREALKANDGYCPCQITKSKETKCICKEFAEQEQSGYCHCELYYKSIED